jgi:EAL domain-containing protein (putative c-di-GMP-specific phosphodiesterase class I)
MAIVVGKPDDVPDELGQMAAKFGWAYNPEFGVIEISVGKGFDVHNVGDLHDLLFGILKSDEVASLRATWLELEQPLEEQMFAIINAEPLKSVISIGSGWLQDMIEDNRLETWFQPVVRVDDFGIWAFECLIRGRDKDGNVVGALDIISAAREENLLFMFDRHCRETHIRSAAANLAGTDIRFLINFLPTVIYQPEFCLKTTLKAARDYNVKPERIIFEVVETENVDDSEHLQRVLRYYRDNGFGIALDDLGSGYSGLNWMAELSPDLIKIDRSIVSGAIKSKAHQSIAKAIIDLGHDNGQLVLAEGVETQQEFDLMRDLGADLCQGYYFGKPAPEIVSVWAPQG